MQDVMYDMKYPDVRSKMDDVARVIQALPLWVDFRNITNATCSHHSRIGSVLAWIVISVFSTAAAVGSLRAGAVKRTTSQNLAPNIRID